MAKYIDADAVIKELRQIYHSCDDWENYISQSGASESEKRILINRASATRAAMIEVRLRVNKMLPADVVERKKGKWIMEWDCFFHREVPVCSQCLRADAYKFDVCSNCGADMREKEKTDGHS